jgi:hypothetical protein
MKTYLLLILLLGGLASCTPASHVTYAVKNASSSPFTLQFSYDQRDTSLVFQPNETKKVAYFNRADVKPSFFKKLNIISSRKKKFLLNLKDENSWKFTLKSKDLFKSCRGEYSVEILDTDFK